MAKEYYVYDTEKNEVTPIENKKTKKRRFLKNVDKWAVFKKVISVAAGGCASHMVNRYLHANLPEAQSITEKIVTGIGVYFVTGMVAEKVSEYAEAELDEFKQSVESAKTESTEEE